MAGYVLNLSVFYPQVSLPLTILEVTRGFSKNKYLQNIGYVCSAQNNNLDVKSYGR